MEKAKLRDGSFRASLLKYAKEKHGTRPDYPWEKYPGNAVLRHLDSNKWYGIIMDVERDSSPRVVEQR